MRDIKFRAWDTLTNKMICTGFHVIGEVTVFGLIDQYIRENIGGKSSLDRYNDIEITQFTGLKDKNGREIYEGDILESVHKEIEFGPFTTYFQGEYWNTDGSNLEYKTEIDRYLIESCPSQFFQRKYINKFYTNSGKLDGQPITGLLNSCDNSTVIGNIFETPKLLK